MARRKIPCRCQTAKQMTNPVKKSTIDLSAYFPFITVPVQAAFDFVADIATSTFRTKPSKEVAEGECESCGGTGEIEDYTDRTDETNAVAQKAQAIQKEVTDLESKLGPMGGNYHMLVAGDHMLEVGLAFNDSKGYDIEEDASRTRGGVKMYKKGPVAVDTKINGVVRGNPISTPGGNYIVKCGNKCTVRPGVGGFEVHSEGAFIARTGPIEFTGPEITLGAAKGQLVLDAQAVNVNGTAVNINAAPGGKGQVSIGGTLHTTGNAVIQGGVHAEGGLSAPSIITPTKEERSRHSSQDIQTTGAAVWLAQAVEQATKDFARVRKLRIADISGLALTPREVQNIISETKNLLKKSLPVEPVPTGIILPGTPILINGVCPCNQGGTASGTIIGVIGAPVELRNFPHHHPLSDSPHAHPYRGPNFRGTDDDEGMRGAIAGIDSAAPITAKTDTGGILEKIIAFAGVIGIGNARVDTA